MSMKHVGAAIQHCSLAVGMLGFILLPLAAQGQLVPLSTGKAVSATTSEPIQGLDGAESRRIAPQNDCKVRKDWRHRKLSVGEVTGTLNQARAYFNSEGFRVGGGVGVSSSEQASAVYSEVASDFFRLGGPLGYAKFGVGAMLVQSKDTSAEASAQVNNATALDRFRLGGGNVVAFLAIPLLHYESRSGGCSSSRFDILMLPRAAADVPNVDGSTDVSTGMLDAAAEVQWVAITVSRIFKVFATARGGYVRGTDSFYSGLGLEGRDAGFWYARWEFGLDVSGRLRLSAARLAGGPSSLVASPIVAQVQLIP